MEDGLIAVNDNTLNWFGKVRDLLSKYGFNYVWSNNSQINEVNFLSLFKQRVIDEYLQEWNRDINDNRVLIVYKAIKTTFSFEPYLETIVSRNLRTANTQIRICAHNLRIQTGRYDRLERNLRLCQICDSNEIENEYHFLLKCSKFAQIK